MAVLRSNEWLLNLVFIGAGAHFAAGAVSTVVAHQVGILPTGNPVSAARQPPGRTPADGRLSGVRGGFAAIAERNLCALKREDLNPVPISNTQPSDQAPQQGEIAPQDLRPCTLSSALRATIVADDAPEWSIAVMYSGTDHDASVFTINSGSNRISDDATLVEIRSREVIVRRRDHFERCMAEGEGGPSFPASPQSPRQLSLPDGGGDHPSGEIEGVTKVSATEYQIERDELDRVLSNLNEVATQARIVPSFKNGKANGFKLFSIKPGSIYAKIGLQNGDVIQKINGYEMNTPDKALEIYQRLREASSVSVELQRRGQPMTFSYNIQ